MAAARLADALRCAGVRLRWAVDAERLLAVLEERRLVVERRLPVEVERRVPVEAERLRVVLLRRVLVERLVPPVLLFWVAM